MDDVMVWPRFMLGLDRFRVSFDAYTLALFFVATTMFFSSIGSSTPSETTSKSESDV